MCNLFKCIMSTVLSIAICISFCSCDMESSSAYIFADISECKNFEDKLSENVELTLYDTPEEDKNLNDLEYISFYAAKYETQEIKFKIYAYEFIDSDEAKKYFETSAGRDSIGNKDFYINTNLIKHTIRVLDGERAYVLYSEYGYKEAINELLSEVFTIESDNNILVEQLTYSH